MQDAFTCSAVGEEPMLVLAAEADLHIMGFYSPRDIKVTPYTNMISALKKYERRKPIHLRWIFNF